MTQMTPMTQLTQIRTAAHADTGGTVAVLRAVIRREGWFMICLPVVCSPGRDVSAGHPAVATEFHSQCIGLHSGGEANLVTAARSVAVSFWRSRTAAELSKRLITEAKQTVERSWLGEVSAVVLQQSLRDAETAYRNFFASLKGTRKGPRTGPPRFKSRKDARQSIRFTSNARWNITDSGRLNLPKVGPVKVKWSRALPATPSSVTVIKDAADRFFASFVIHIDPAGDQARMPDTDRTIGIDLGLTHFAVLSDGTKTDSPRFLRRAEKKLKKAQRELSRKQKGSKNRAKARGKVARVHAKVADARREFHHQLSTKLISENPGIAVEDLAVAGLACTKLAKSVHDAGWSSFISMLEYKAERYGRTLVKIGRFEPTSQTCSTCGVKDGPKPLNVREWTCAACGTVHDRDTNAAINVKTAAGLAASACGAPVRPGAIPAQREETGSHGIPPQARAA
jgi:putative transposase